MPVGAFAVRLSQGLVKGGEGLAGVGTDAQAGAVGLQDPGLGVDLDDPAARFKGK